LNYSDETLDQARAALEGYYLALDGLQLSPDAPIDEALTAPFFAAMDDDFNTPEALAVLSGLRRDINAARQAGDQQRAGHIGSQLKRLGAVLGLFQHEPLEFLRGVGGDAGSSELSDDDIDKLVGERQAARESRDWLRADQIRDELKVHGIVLDDSAGGTRWRRE
jgi:cysteinyl-tRNA synthetase